MISRQVERLTLARTALVLDAPFFGALSLRMPFVLAPEKTRTMATDGRAVYFAEDYVDKCADAQLVWSIAHEVLHCALLHHTRREARDAERWNVACDYAINPLLDEAGFAAPPIKVCNDPAYKGMSAEEIYARLPPPPPPPPPPESDDSSGEDDSADDGGQDDAPGSGNSDADADDNGDGNPLADMPGAILDAPEPAQDEGEWQLATKQAANAAAMMGKLPSGMAALIKEQTRPKVDWRALLRRFVQECARADYSMRTPNRRYIQQGLFLPSLRSEAMPPLVFIVDTSGSTQSMLAAFRAEAQSIVEECAPECTYVVHCDADVAHVETVERDEALTMETMHGGGGTDFRPPFAWVDAEGVEPACAVYITDGDGTYPDQAPAYPVLWAMTTARVAPWGETVRLEEPGA